MKSCVTTILWIALALLPLPQLRASYFYAGGAAAGSPTPELLWWKSNNGSGTTITGDAATSDDGTTDADWATGKSGSGSSVNYNGSSDDSFTSGSIAWGTNIITVCCWVYWDSTANHVLWQMDGDPLGVYTGGFMFLIEGGTVFAGMQDSTGGMRRETCALPSTGAWVHLTVLYDSTATVNIGDIKVYYDGVLQTGTPETTTKVLATTFTTAPLELGYRVSTVDRFFDGKMDDLRVYSGDKTANIAAISADAQ